jgi:hypothetical protein
MAFAVLEDAEVYLMVVGAGSAEGWSGLAE